MSTDSSTRATGRTDVISYEPRPYDEPGDAPMLVAVHMVERFSGDITGEGTARILQAVRQDGSASYVAMERVTGSIAGRSGSFLLQVTGTIDGTDIRGDWFVIAGSGNEELAGLRGEGGFSAELGKHGSITLDYWFE